MGTEIPVVTAIALTKAETNRLPDLTDIIGDKMHLREGIVETKSIIAFRTYSRHQLEAGIELGLD
jgi:hypothetical protein